MVTLLVVLHLLAFLSVALALPVPAVRRIAMVLLLGAGVVSVVAGSSEPAERELVTVHTYAGFQGDDLEVSMVRFPTGTARAPGWQWPLAFGAFALLWTALLAMLGQRRIQNPLLLPLAFATTATAAWLGMQVLAAPSELVQPVGLDRLLWPAGLAAALLAAARARTLLVLFTWIGSAVLLTRLPAALFSKLASDLRLGTCLDISPVRDIVNPMTQMQFQPRLEPGSAQQQFWLIWLEHVIMFPAVYSMSLLGVALGAWFLHKHRLQGEGGA